MKRILAAILPILALLCCGGIAAAAYPDKPVTFVVGYAPGGTADVSVRMLADRMQKHLGQPIVIQNKGGAGGIIGLESVLRAAPDGYTVFAGAPFVAVSSSYFLKKKPLSLEDMEMVGGYMPQERCLFVPADAPYTTWEEFVDYVKKNPGAISIGSGASQWSTDLLKAIAHKEGLNYNLVMYKSGGEASSDFFGGHIQAVELGVGTPVYQAAREGKARLIIDLAADTVPFFEDTPTLLSKGYPWAVYTEYGFSVPKGTPEPVRATLEAALKATMEDPELIQLMKNAGYLPRFQTGAEYLAVSKECVTNIESLLHYLRDNNLQ